MTKTISANSLNFANLYPLFNFLFSRIHWTYQHNNAGINGLHWSCIFLYFVLKDKLKQAGGHVHSVKQRIAAASRAWGINRYVDDLIICITLCKKGEKQSPKNILFNRSDWLQHQKHAVTLLRRRTIQAHDSAIDNLCF